MCITTCELREKTVINVCDGQKLGCVAELEIDTDCGGITAIFVYGDSFISLLFGKNKIRIPWDKIKCIGKDTVLVETYDIAFDKCSPCRSGKGKNGR